MRIELEKYLETEPRARERRNKNRALGNFLMVRFGITLPKEQMQQLISDVLNADRLWRKILEDRPDLRGSDYEEKDELEIKKQQELGYRVANP